jgi:hypothetical protein
MRHLGQDSDALESDLLDAHAANDRKRLVSLYKLAADRAEGVGEADAAAFFLTFAYVYALETGAADTPILQARLRDLGREE